MQLGMIGLGRTDAGMVRRGAAIDAEVPVLSAALFERFTSPDNADCANRVLSAMRDEFGGHAKKPAS